MSSLFDRLQNELDKREEEGKEGISPLDFVDLPAPLRRMMRMMLRETKLTYPKIVESLTSMPGFQQTEKAELDQSLDALVKQEWLIRIGVAKKATYRVNLSRKRGSRLDASIWSTIDKKIEERIQQQQQEADTAEEVENEE